MDSPDLDGLAAFVFDGASVDSVEKNVEEWPDEDAFGNTGTTAIEHERAVAPLLAWMMC